MTVSEFDGITPDTLPEAYPRFILMYEFFRLVRGEAFQASRPHGMGQLQKELYAMEDDLAQRLARLEATLDKNDRKTSYHLDTMQQAFRLHRFNRS